jgi:hypothetical protein
VVASFKSSHNDKTMEFLNKRNGLFWPILFSESCENVFNAIDQGGLGFSSHSQRTEQEADFDHLPSRTHKCRILGRQTGTLQPR